MSEQDRLYTLAVQAGFPEKHRKELVKKIIKTGKKPTTPSELHKIASTIESSFYFEIYHQPSKEVREYLKDGRATIEEDLFRGSGKEYDFLKPGAKVKLAGKPYSSDPGVAESFGEKTIFQVKGPKKATPFEGYSVYPEEKEHRMMSGTRGKITKIEDRSVKRVYIEADEWQPESSETVEESAESVSEPYSP